MALKGDRINIYDDVTFFSSGLGEKGQIVVLGGVGSGAALDQSAAYVFVAATASGNLPIGMLLQDLVNYDLTKTHINFHREEVQTGGKVAIMKKGWAVTDQVTGNPNGGNKAYLTNNGKVTPTFVNASATPLVGVFMSIKDEDGYAKVEIDIPLISN